MSQSWKPLSLSPNNGDHPPLLISSHFTPTSYTIQITDLTRLWAETLDRRAILRRSILENTAIDPSEDAEQMRMLLQKIEGAIRGEEGTELILKHDSSTSTSDAPRFYLHITASLPKPLPPLEWPVSLSQSDPLAFTEAVTLPLIAAQNARIKEMENLVETLKDKDHVIQKLVDSLEASGSDLGKVFPLAALKGNRKTTRTQAAQKVKGISVFDKLQWQRDMQKSASEADVNQLATEVFGADDGPEIRKGDGDLIPDKWETWWRNFNGSSKKSAISSTAVTTSINKSKEIADEDDVGGGDLQVRSTPVRSSPISTNKRSPGTMNDSTEDEDGDLDVETQRSAIPDSYPMPSSSLEIKRPEPKGKKLGVIGKPKTAIKPSPTPQVIAEADDTTEDEHMNSPPASSPPSPPKAKVEPPMKPKKGGLGKIGGRKRKVSPLPESPRKLELEHDEVPSPATPKKKLGVIGRKSQVSSSPAVEGESRGRSPAAVEKEESPPRETSAERKARRNEELKKELEVKKPAKKKRKF